MSSISPDTLSSFHRRRLLRSCAFVFCLVFAAAFAQLKAQVPVAADPAAKAEPSGEGFSRVRGLFDVDLPKTVGKYRIKYLVHPHFGDLARRDYLRVPVGLRLGVNDHTEINAELESYVTHGLGGSAPGYGLYAFHLGAKYEWLKWLKPHVDTSSGFNTTFPLSRPPVELTDGHNHFSPYVVFSKPWAAYPGLTPFVNISGDFIAKTAVPGRFAKNQPHSDSCSIAPGFLWERGAFKYAVTVTYATTAVFGSEPAHYFRINPSVLWELPPTLTFNSTGRWIVGLGFNADFGPDGHDFGTRAKLRGEFSFTRMLHHTQKLLPRTFRRPAD